jgi:single-strand DNA-binding protein
MPLPQVTIEGNLGADPELRFSQSGAAYCTFRVGTSERKFNQQTNAWEDGRNCWCHVIVWRNLAENVAESLKQGDKVTVTGVLYDDSYERDGTTHQVKQVEGKSVSASLSNATVEIRRAQRQQGQGQGQQQPGQGQQQRQPQGGGWTPGSGQPADDSWRQPPAQPAAAPQGGGGWGQPSYDEPPFAFPPNTVVT